MAKDLDVSLEPIEERALIELALISFLSLESKRRDSKSVMLG